MAITFTQGDNAVLQLSAQDGNENPINITSATFQTQILGPNGQAIATFGNSQHAIVNAAAGTFTLTLATTDTAACGIGGGKEIVTAITISGLVTYYHGPGILTVLPAVPLQ